MIRVLQNPLKTTTMRPDLFGKWWASKRTGQTQAIDMVIDEDEDGMTVGPVPMPVSKYIGPNGWQDNTHYFDSSEECVAALLSAGIKQSDLVIVPWTAPVRKN
jgi:hypothetical protein